MRGASAKGAMTDPYLTLGIDPTADAAEIRQAYLRLMRRWHPDRPGGEGDAARAQEVTAAYELLRNPERRENFDRARRPARPAPPAPTPSGRAAAATTRGGQAGRNLFLLLAVGTGWLGWQLASQPAATPPAARTAATATERRAEGGSADREAALAQADLEAMRSALSGRAGEEPEPAPAPVAAAVEEPPVVLPDLPVATPAPAPLVRRLDPRARPTASAPAPVAVRRAAPSPVRMAAASPAPTPAREDGAGELAQLDRHLALLTDQSIRFGNPAKRLRIVETGAAFAGRLRSCPTSACRRDAYLRRNEEVAAIMRD